MTDLTLSGTDVCLSGGARGADAYWGQLASLNGHDVIHWSFAGHKTRVPPHQVAQLTREQLTDADPFVARANRTLHRVWPLAKQSIADLLRRNYYQVAWADAVYAVSHFDGFGQVSGGTAWACQMFIDRFGGGACPVHVFDQRKRRWFTWTENGFRDLGPPPRPHGVWAGIGTRDLNPDGEGAIRALFNDPAF